MDPVSEATKATGAGIAGWKIIGGVAGLGVFGAVLSTIVVMCLTKPHTQKEWAVALICTVLGSITGGATLVQYLNIQSWAYTPFGMVSLLGIAFACGLPAWAIVRWVFNYINRHADSDIVQVAQDVKGMKP